MGSIEQKIFTLKNGDELIVRNAKPEDAESLIFINISVLSELIYMLREPEEANYTKEAEIKNIESLRLNKGELYIVAVVENKVVGYLDFKNGGFIRTEHCGNFSIFILKEWREAGIGKILLQTFIDWAEKNPLIEKITLQVFSTNERAQNLYKILGFIEEGRCPKDMKLKDGTYIDSVLMYKFVRKYD